METATGILLEPGPRACDMIGGSLPNKKTIHKASSEERDPLSRERPYHILLVDDDPFIREFISLFFRKKGIEVTEAKHGLEALELFKLQPKKFDLLITDFQMPQMNGRVLIATLKKIAPHLPMILCSATSREKIGKGAVGVPDEDYFFKKPYPIEKLEQAVKSLIQYRD